MIEGKDALQVPRTMRACKFGVRGQGFQAVLILDSSNHLYKSFLIHMLIGSSPVLFQEKSFLFILFGVITDIRVLGINCAAPVQHR